MTAGKIFSQPLSWTDVARMAEHQFGDWIKAVVDLDRGILAIGGGLHADDEALLLASGSRQRDLWGINLHPNAAPSDRVEFDSLINVRPRDGNRSRGVDDPGRREAIRRLVDTLISDPST